MLRPPSPETQRKAVERWNALHSIGTPVAVTKDDGSIIRIRTRSEAQMLSGHTAVIFLEGISGCYLLSRVAALPTPEAA